MFNINKFVLLSLLTLTALSVSGCNSRRALIEHRFNEVEPETLVDIGEEADASHAGDLVALLESRANEGNQAIDEEQAVEALIALDKMYYSEDAELFLALADSDESSDVRYFAVKALKSNHPGAFALHREKLLESETDPLVSRLLDGDQ